MGRGAAEGWDAEGNAFQAHGRGREVEGGGGRGVGHFSDDGDLLAGPVGEEPFRALGGEGWDFEFAAFPSDGGFVDSGFEGDIAVRHLSEEGDFLFRPVQIHLP